MNFLGVIGAIAAVAGIVAGLMLMAIPFLALSFVTAVLVTVAALTLVPLWLWIIWKSVRSGFKQKEESLSSSLD